MKSNEKGLANSGIPLGGLGTGSVEIRSDGYLHEWQIMNNGPWGSGPEINVSRDNMFFALQAGTGADGRSFILGLPLERNTWLNDLYHIPWIEHPESIDADTRFPFTTLNYNLPGVPVDVSLEAFSPFIPFNENDSGLPLAFFSFTIKNRSKKSLAIGLNAALGNLTGYTDKTRLSTMQLSREKHSTLAILGREGVSERTNDYGTMCLGAASQRGVKVTHQFHPRNSRDLWEPLRERCELENSDLGEFSGTLGNVGASQKARLRQGFPHALLCQSLTLAPGATTQLRFVLAWHFPSFQDRGYGERNLPPAEIGHWYAKRFEDATAVCRYGLAGYERLRSDTAAFTDAFLRSTMPRWLLDTISAQFTTLVKSSWWDLKGRFGIWEGLGCCGLQTTDITYYGSFPIVQWFPQIQKSQMRLTRDNIETRGKVPHMMPGCFACGDTDERGRIDLIPQFILLVWRDALWTGDTSYAREMWQTVVDGLELFKTFDTDGDGLPNNRGPDQTYDQFPLKGTSAFVGFLYAASLEAAAQLADLLGHDEQAGQWRALLRDATPKLEKQLWNGQYYRLCYDPSDGVANEGVMADQANADWFWRQSTGNGFLPSARVRSALKAIVRYCSTPQQFVANCAWPKGGAVTIGRHTADQANWPWTGVEFSLAAHLILAGLEREGLKVTRDIWERHERSGARFNHIECGEHYYRALSSWAVYLALNGFAYDGIKDEITLRARPKTSRSVVYTRRGWGEVEVASRGTLLKITAITGVIDFSSVTLTGATTAKVSVTLDGRPVACACEKTGAGVRITMNKPVTFKAGAICTVRAAPKAK